MGSRYLFTCPNCQYSAEVSGGEDYGFVAVVQTMICRDCQELVDVLVGQRGTVGPTGDPEYDKDLNLCPQCRKENLRPWSTDRPCPRCGTSMDQEELRILWD
jgi:hypothetical protein